MNIDRYSETMTAIETTTEIDKQVTRIEIKIEIQKNDRNKDRRHKNKKRMIII
jgi:hypothetical protein